MNPFKYRVTGSYKDRHMVTSYCSSLALALAVSMSYAAQGWYVTIN